MPWSLGVNPTMVHSLGKDSKRGDAAQVVSSFDICNFNCKKSPNSETGQLNRVGGGNMEIERRILTCFRDKSDKFDIDTNIPIHKLFGHNKDICLFPKYSNLSYLP